LRWHFAPPPPSDSFKKAYEDDNVVIYENLRVLPRVFIVHNAVFTKRPFESLQNLKAERIDFRKKAILEVSDKNEREEIENILKAFVR
jgi:hypothetical protein